MSFQSRLWDLLQETRAGAVIHVRNKLAESIEVAEYNDRGIAEPGKERGSGFALFIGEWRIGWWATRYEACQVRDSLADAIRGHSIHIPPAS